MGGIYFEGGATGIIVGPVNQTLVVFKAGSRGIVDETGSILNNPHLRDALRQHNYLFGNGSVGIVGTDHLLGKP